MKKLFKVIMSLSLIVSIVFTPINVNAATNEEKNDTIVVEKYKIIDNYREVSYIDPNKANTYSTDRYIETRYSVKGSKLLKYDAISKDNELFLISVPRGYELRLETSKTITGSLSADGSITAGEKKAISGSFSLNASGSISKTYTSQQTFTFPEQYKDKYSTANYYTAISYDLYEIQMHSYDLYDHTQGGVSHPVGTNYQDYIIKVYIPKIVMYTVGVNYGN